MQTPMRGASGVDSPASVVSGSSASPTPGPNTGGSSKSNGTAKKSDVSTYDVLRYIRSAFDDEAVLDHVPLEAAGNPGAWQAWRTHQIKQGRITPVVEKSNWHEGLSDDESSPSSAGVPDGYHRLAGGTSAPMTARRPGEWNWDGVWEVRVKKGVEASVSEAQLFGSTAGDDLIHFLHLDAEQIETMKENIGRSLETVEPHRRGIV